MSRVLGIIAAIILIFSSAAHSLLGWDALGAQLAQANAPADLINGLRIGWQFGGACMMTFGIIALVIFVRRMPSLPAFAIGVLYVAFGAWALVASGFDPFMAIFIVPGVMLLVAAWPR
ncbi:MAG: hypothetical protein ACJ74H_01310 [Thermoanaerobaculia bacterium]